MKHLLCTRLEFPVASFLVLAALSGCSGAESDDGDVAMFTGVTPPGAAPPAAVPPAPGIAQNGAPAATPPANAPSPSPTPGSEQPPVTGGVAPSGAPTMVGATPAAPGTPAPGTPEPNVPPSTAPVGAGSAGCGTTAVPAQDAVANNLLFFPPGYDGNTPTPLVFAFHGANRTNVDQRMVDSRTVGSELEANYIVAYMKSAGGGWDINADHPRFEAALEQIQAIACVDTAHIFAFGHSSGAQFIAQMLGNPNIRETRFAAVAPVSSSDYGNPDWTPVPTLLIHGLNDTSRGGDNNGELDISQYAESNQCSAQRTLLQMPSCASFAGGVAVNPGCMQYEGCAAPTLFCQHNDPNYLNPDGSPTNHGWPCFANSQIFQFFESQR